MTRPIRARRDLWDPRGSKLRRAAGGRLALGLVALLALVLPNSPSSSSESFRSGAGALKGSWGFVGADLHAAGNDAHVGLLTFDGIHSCSGEVTKATAARRMETLRIAECSYEIGKAGRGIVDMTLDDGTSFDLALVVTDAGLQVLYVGAEPRTSVYGEMHPRSTAEGSRFDDRSVVGRWAFQSRVILGKMSVVFAGVVTFDGRGGCAIELTENNPAEPLHDHRSTDCTYAISKDGRGTMVNTLDDGVVETRSLVLSQNSRHIGFVVTPDIPATVGTGVMVKT